MRDILIENATSGGDIRRRFETTSADPQNNDAISDKIQHITVHLFNLTCQQISVLKRELAAKGGQAAAIEEKSADVGGGSQVFLNGSLYQLKQLIENLNGLSPDLVEIGLRIETALTNYTKPFLPPLRIKDRLYDWSRTYVMGIVNITPDSFSADGLYQKENYVDLALAQAEKMVEDGADFLDIGAESTRPGYTALDVEEEEKRLAPVLKELVRAVKVPISVDTYKPEVAEKALNIGIDLLNDIWGLQAPNDPAGRMARLATDSRVPVIIMHNKSNSEYTYLINEMVEWLSRSMNIAEKAGIDADKLIVDPGIGFGKTYHHNLEVLKNLHQFKILGKPLLLGTSRKSVVGRTLDLPADQRVEGTIATVVWGMMQGANIMRVHDVRAVARAVKMGEAIRGI